jgi:hypothetical protein
MRLARVIFPIIVVLATCTLLYAKLMGEGEVTGEVIDSWVNGDHVIFSLTISSQKNDKGPKLGDGNRYAFAGSDKMEITKGDIIRLRYNSDDSYGIHVERIEFIDNKPGTVAQKESTLWMILLIGALVTGCLIVFIWRRGLHRRR